MSAAPVATTPTSPNPDAKPASPTPNGSNAKKFEGEGVPFKGKLIGMEDLTVDRDEKICLDSMFKLKAVVRARGDHKQRVQMNLTMGAVKIIDEATKAQIAAHEIERISFVVIDPRDTRAFGYIYNTPDDRHQFWAIKTERAAAFTVIALKELFELAFEKYTNDEKMKQLNQTTAAPVPPSTQPAQVEVSPPPPANIYPTVQAAPATTPPPAPVTQQQQQQQQQQQPQQPAPQPTVVLPPPPSQPPPASLIDAGIWDDNTTTPIKKPDQPANDDIFGFNDPLPVTQPPIDMFSGLSISPASPAPVVAPVTTNQLFDLFSNPNPTSGAPQANQFGGFYSQPVPSNAFNMTPMFNQPVQPTQTVGYTGGPAAPQQQPMGYSSMPGVPQQQPMGFSTMSGVPQQPTAGYTSMANIPHQPMPQNFSMPSNTAPTAPASMANPFGDLDLLGNRSSANTVKSGKELFATPAAKTIQQMQMEKRP